MPWFNLWEDSLSLSPFSQSNSPFVVTCREHRLQVWINVTWINKKKPVFSYLLCFLAVGFVLNHHHHCSKQLPQPPHFIRRPSMVWTYLAVHLTQKYLQVNILRSSSLSSSLPVAQTRTHTHTSDVVCNIQQVVFYARGLSFYIWNERKKLMFLVSFLWCLSMYLWYALPVVTFCGLKIGLAVVFLHVFGDHCIDE